MAQGIIPFKAHAFVNAPANANHLSDDTTDAATLRADMDLSVSTVASFQLAWTGLTGTLNATATIEVSDDPTPSPTGNWQAKSGATYTITTASGSTDIALNLVLAEQWYRINYQANGVTGGTIDARVFGK